MEQPQMTADRVKDILAAAGVSTSTRNLAEALWLASRIAEQQQAAAGQLQVPETPGGAGQPPGGEAELETPRGDMPGAPGNDPVAGTLRAVGAREANWAGAHPVQVPAAHMLRDVLAVQRAVRPLKRTVGSGRRRRLDETATAARIADTGLWLPVLAEDLEPWLDLALVVDTGPAMRLWHPLARELSDAISQVGAFRDVRVWYLVGDRLSASPAGPLTDAASLVDPGGRRAVLILSDCSGGHWWSARATRAVHTWARRGPTAIVQPLPERMWHRTGAPVLAGAASSPFPGAPNAALDFAPDLPPLELPRQAVPVPVLELDPVWLADWATLVAGRGAEAVRTAITYVSPYPRTGRRERVLREATLSVADRVRRFQEVASPEAGRLAAHIAVSVPALPVMRLIQHTVPDAQPGHLGEVLLSGLLRPAGPDLYEFIDEEVRDRLLATLPRSESWHTIDMLRRVSADIAQRAGRARVTFSAVLDVADRDNADGDPANRPFALVSAAAVRSLSSLAVPLRPAAERSATEFRVPTPRRGRSHSAPGPLFFLSYARTPRRDSQDKSDPDRLVYKLYRDLCQQILDIQDINPSAVGHMDRNNQVGDNWPDELADALATCRVFVPLYSERYFSSVNCGKEWFAFRSRELNQQARMLKSRSAILPALWTPIRPEKLPPATKDLLYAHPDFGRHYAQDGFYGIMKLSRYRREYQEAVYRFAQLIVERAQQVGLSPGQPADYVSLPNAFGGREVAQAAPFQISMLAPHLGTLPPGRSSAYYGASALDWRPYQPESASPIADYCAELARISGVEAVIGLADQQVPEWARTGGPTAPTLVVVDPWATMSPLHAEELRLLDGFDQSWLSVITPWNIQDEQTADAEEELRAHLRQSLGRRWAPDSSRAMTALSVVPTLQDLGDLLPELVSTMTRRFIRDSPANTSARPQIERPGLRRNSE
jgi:FxsC-like protein